jgi:DNA repair protein RecO (recombination protein O)
LATSKRISDEAAYVLHRYDWSETSLILEVFTRNYGRIALVAKGAKRPHSSFRPVLLPLQALQVAFGGEAEIRTLKAAEWMGGHVMPTGEALLAGCYLNELLMLLLARDDPHPGLFEVYANVVELLASEHGAVLQTALRAFELLLLREIGLLPMLDAQTMTLGNLQAESRYCLVPEGGLRQSNGSDRNSLTGRQWQSLHKSLGRGAPLTETLRSCSEVLNELKPQLRALLNYHCGIGTLRTRQMMLDIQAL